MCKTNVVLKRAPVHGLDFSKCFIKMNWLTFSVLFQTMLHSKFKSCNWDFSKFWCTVDWAKSFQLSNCSFEVIIPFQNTCLCESGFFSMMTIKQNIDLDWSPRMTWQYLFQPLFPESQILCEENKHKSLTEWLTDWNFLSFLNKRQI